ncbi:MAG: flagellar basal body L-ring protein FlgH [Ferrovum sp.]|nr:flagellar basal body L-ring protein FlgH [Ferrovum sp.]NDU88090.1 flagellar basal body L-ring protein FlgH [Ferrovum sp.]
MFSRFFLVLGFGLLAGCAVTPSTHITSPLSARPVDLYKTAPPDTGGIFQTGYSQHPLFEDNRARNLGDTLQIILQENTSATEANGNGASHASTLASTTPAITNAATGQHVLDGVTTNGSTTNKLTNTGNSTGNNFLTGSITATVIEVLPNGNLKVSGEKLVSINQVDEYIRISGVVNPVYVQTGNTIISTQLADAHVEYKGGNANIDGAALMNLVGRFFMSAVPY